MKTKYKEKQNNDEVTDVIHVIHKKTTLSNMEDLKTKMKNKDVFLRIHADWCGHCKHLSPIWNEFASYIEQNKSDFKDLLLESIEETNLKENNKFPELMEYVRGFPTLLYIKKGTFNISDLKKGAYEYKGSRNNMQDFINFVKEQMKTDSESRKSEKTHMSGGGGRSRHKRKTNKRKTNKRKHKNKVKTFHFKRRYKSKSKKMTRKKYN